MSWEVLFLLLYCGRCIEWAFIFFFLECLIEFFNEALQFTSMNVPSTLENKPYFTIFDATIFYLVSCTAPHSSHSSRDTLYYGSVWRVRGAILSFWSSICAVPETVHGNQLQYACLENCMGRGVWRATIHGVAKSQTRLSE